LGTNNPTEVNSIVTPGVTIIENAYTNNQTGATTTTQYIINDENDSLGILANNFGTVTPVTVPGSGVASSLGVAVSGANVGFDIFSDKGANIAYLLVGNNLHTVDLVNGTASSVRGTLSGVSNVRSLAVVPAVVPEAGTLPMVLGAAFSVLGVGMVRRRNKK
jgi:hypothetical protein